MPVNFAMEEELKCPVCHNLFVDPVILPCTHNLCSKCAETLKSKNGAVTDLSPDYSGRVGPDFDKVSLLSEAVFSDTDSGYSAGSLRSNSSDQGRAVSLSSINGVSPSVSGSQIQPSSPVASSPKIWPQTLGVHLPSLPESISCLTCPVCQRTVFLDDRGVGGLTQNVLMLNIIKKFENRGNTASSEPNRQALENSTEDKQIHKPPPIESQARLCDRNGLTGDQGPVCQMCEMDAAQIARVKCEQCLVQYCTSCRDRFHPCRGPLANHTLTEMPQSNSRPTTLLRTRQNSESTEQNVNGDLNANAIQIQASPCKRRSQSVPAKADRNQDSTNGMKLSQCSFHIVENMSMYCGDCQAPLCYQCLEDGRHRSHDVKAIGATYKSHKADLSQQMSALSNKARQAKDLVMHLRYVQDEIQKNSVDFEARAVAQCNALVDAINHKKQELIQRVAAEKEVRCKMVREQLQQCTMKLKQTTGLLEYCIEAMKNNEPAPFLQVSSGLIKRVAATEQQWTEHHLAPRAKSDFDFEMDATPLLHAIENFNVIQRRVPEPPTINLAGCRSTNNTITLSWLIQPTTQVDAFILELDDGAKGRFRDVYRGQETLCCVDGLHFNSIYRARVSAYNKTGRSRYSEVVQLQTAEVAVFCMDQRQSHPDIKFTNHFRTVNCASTENRVSLGNIGFSKGVHYWEYSVDRYDSSNPDVVVGVAHAKVDKGTILGKDRYAWAMYIDKTRTWFYHGDEHTNRFDGGVDVGSRLGVLLDTEKQQVTFYVNQKQRGSPVSLIDEDSNVGNRNRNQLFFPAVSLNRQVQVTLWSGQRPPVQIRPTLYHSHSFTGPAHSNSYKNRMLANHGILGTSSNSVPRSNKVPSSPTQQQKRSQSSGDLKGQRLYNSLPSQPVVQMSAPAPSSGTIEPNAEQTNATEPGEAKPAINPVKPALKKKPQLPNGFQAARGRQQRLGSFKVPPQPPLRRGSSNSSLSTVSSSTKSSESDNVSCKMTSFQ